MRLITPADDELYGLAAAAARLGRAHKLLARLAQACQADPADARAATWYALGLMAALPGVGIEFEAHARFAEAIEAFGRVLALDPDTWIALYGRARLRVMMPTGYGAAASHASAELTGAMTDLEYLMDRQDRLPAEPYFVSVHALAIAVDHLTGRPAVGRRAALLAALAGHPRVPIPFPALGAVLREPLAALHSGAVPDRDAIGELLSVSFGDRLPVPAAPGRREG